MPKKIMNEFSKKFLKDLSYQTPFFLFSKKSIVHNIEEFKKYFPGSLIHYAMKANSEPDILKLMLDEGACFEVASKYELEMLKALKVPPKKIIYGTSVKPASHIKEFFDYGVDRFAFDSLSELEKIATMAPGSKVYVRVVANDRGSVFKFHEKFGTERKNIVPLLKRAKELGLHPYGISFHVGSQAGNMMAWAGALEGLSDVMDQLSRLGIVLDVMNIGGGFPCNAYISSKKILPLKKIARHTLNKYKRLPYQPRLVLEPGRGLIADTGVLVASVIGKVERRSQTWLFLDAGVYGGLFESMAFQGSTRYKISAICKNREVGEALFDLGGPTGDSLDVIARDVLLPEGINVGDKIVIHDIGAYSLPATCPFNGFPKPEVYFT